MEERKQKILRAIVQSYIATAEPVGSRTIARVYDLGISSATIRNEMQDLELMGYLEQPHTSAGRVPSLKGYRFYVDSLMHPSGVSEEEKATIKEWFDAQNGQTEKIFSEVAKILSSLTHNLSLAVHSNAEKDLFNYIQFLPLDKQRAILLLVSKEGHVDNSVFRIPEGVAYGDLQSFAEKVNRVLHNVPLNQITAQTIHELQKDLLLREEVSIQTFAKIQNALTNSKEFYADGMSELIRQPEFQDMEKITRLISLIEESTQLAELLDTELSSAVNVRIGPETGVDWLEDYSVVQAQFFTEEKLIGTVAVVGPTRMEYSKVISLLHFMQQKINQLIRLN